MFLLPFIILVMSALIWRSSPINDFSENCLPQIQNAHLSPEFSEHIAKLGALRAQVDRLNSLGEFIAKQENIDIDM